MLAILMNIGVIEIAVVLIVTIPVVIAVALNKKAWLLGIPAFFVVATVFSPPDPLSTLAIALPCCCIYVFALLKTRPADGLSGR